MELPLPQPADREEWRPIPGAPGYEVSSLGRVMSFRKNGRRGEVLDRPVRLLRPGTNGHGRKHVVLQINRREVSRPVHRLVLAAFVGSAPAGRPEGRHLNGDASNDSINNLAWGSHAENMQDMARHGSVKGERHGMAKLREEQVFDVLARLDRGESRRSIADSLSISPGHVRQIEYGIAWGWLTGIKRKEVVA